MTRVRLDKNLDEKCANCGVLLIGGWDEIVWAAAGPFCSPCASEPNDSEETR